MNFKILYGISLILIVVVGVSSKNKEQGETKENQSDMELKPRFLGALASWAMNKMAEGQQTVRSPPKGPKGVMVDGECTCPAQNTASTPALTPAKTKPQDTPHSNMLSGLMPTVEVVD